jgi:hypothetical protein
MDITDMLSMAGVSTTGVALILLVYRILKSIKGKKLTSTCCGKKLDIGIDVSNMTPKQTEIQNPMHISVVSPPESLK